MAKPEKLFKRRQVRTRAAIQRRAVDRPRLTVFRSNRYIYAQVIDDKDGKTLVSASSLEKDLRAKFAAHATAEAANEVGKLIAQRAKAAGISTVVFDRGGYRYHGRVKALADAAREGGLSF